MNDTKPTAPPKDKAGLPDALMTYRTRAGLSRSQMAEPLGVSGGRYGEVEDGIRDLSKAMLRRAYRAGVPPEVIFAVSTHEPFADFCDAGSELEHV